MLLHPGGGRRSGLRHPPPPGGACLQRSFALANKGSIEGVSDVRIERRASRRALSATARDDLDV